MKCRERIFTQGQAGLGMWRSSSSRPRVDPLPALKGVCWGAREGRAAEEVEVRPAKPSRCSAWLSTARVWAAWRRGALGGDLRLRAGPAGALEQALPAIRLRSAQLTPHPPPALSPQVPLAFSHHMGALRCSGMWADHS